MKNLKNINVEELSTKEMQSIEGGNLLDSSSLIGTLNSLLSAVTGLLNGLLGLLNSSIKIKL